MDADFSHNPKYIPLFLKEIFYSDIVLGSRFLETKYPYNVSTFSLWENRYVRWIARLKTSDSLGGFKCFRRKVIEAIELDNFISKVLSFRLNLYIVL